jgi:hypothetical protein
MRGNSKAYTPLQDGAGGNELPQSYADNPDRVAANKCRRGIITHLADLFEPFADCERRPVLGSHEMKRKLTPHQGDQMLRPIELLG